MRDLSTLIAFIINFIILLSYSVDRNNEGSEDGRYGIEVVTMSHGINFKI